MIFTKKKNETKDQIRVVAGATGYFVARMRWNPAGFWTHVDSLTAIFKSREEAESEASLWAMDEKLEVAL